MSTENVSTPFLSTKALASVADAHRFVAAFPEFELADGTLAPLVIDERVLFQSDRPAQPLSFAGSRQPLYASARATGQFA